MYQSRMLTGDVPGEMRSSYKCLLLDQASRSAEDNQSHAVFLKIEWRIVAMQRYEGVWEYFSRVPDAFVVEVVRFGEQGAK